MDNIFLQISALLALTVSIALVMRLLRQPLIVAYIVAGIVAGPLFLNFISGDQKIFSTFANFGVVLLLFVLGLNLNFNHIKRIGRVSVIAGLSQVIFTAVIGGLILLWLEFSFSSAAYLAIAITFSSTIIIVKLLADKNDTETVYGRYTIGLMIVQDLIAIVIMLIITSLGAGQSLGIELSELALKTAAIFAFVAVMGRVVAPRFLARVAHSGELLFIFTVAWCFGLASLLYWLGFSLEIGAIAAGLTLGSSPYQPEISSRVKPLRDFFLVIFFIILGSQLTITNLPQVWWPSVILALFILFGNPLILYLTFRWLKFTRRNSFLAGVTAAQVSEFGFVLLVMGRNLGHITGPELEIFTVVALLTIIISSYVITYNEQLYRRLLPFFLLFGKDRYRQREKRRLKYDVWVFGYHRIGWKVCEALAARGVSFAVVDFNPETFAELKRRGIPAYFGDAADVEFLESLPLLTAKLIISTLPEVDDQRTLTTYLRQAKSRAFIIGNLYHSAHLAELYLAGADYVMMPHLLGGEWIAGVLKNKPWSQRTFATLRREQKKEMKLRLATAAH